MDDIFAGQLMTSDLYTVAPDTLVKEVAETMLDERVRRDGVQVSRHELARENIVHDRYRHG